MSRKSKEHQNEGENKTKNQTQSYPSLVHQYVHNHRIHIIFGIVWSKILSTTFIIRKIIRAISIDSMRGKQRKALQEHVHKFQTMSVEMLNLTTSKSRSCLLRLWNYLSLPVYTVDVCKYRILVDAKSFLLFFFFSSATLMSKQLITIYNRCFMWHRRPNAMHYRYQTTTFRMTPRFCLCWSVCFSRSFRRFKCQIQLYSLPMSRILAEKYICKLAIMMSKQQIW